MLNKKEVTNLKICMLTEKKITLLSNRIDLVKKLLNEEINVFLLLI
jgi:Trp operon repressor